MRPTLLALAATLIAGSATAASPPLPTLITTQVRIEVAADGSVSSVEPLQALPAPVAAAVREHVAQWRFAAPVQDGTARGGTTYARLSVCAAQDAAGHLAVAVNGWENGPGVDPRMLGTTFFPDITSGMTSYPRIDVEATYEVGVDGRANVLSLTAKPVTARMTRQIEKGFRAWLAPMRFEPERINGEPVATRVAVPITFTFERVERPLRALEREVARERVEQNRSCQALLRDAEPAQGQRTAADSPFRRQPHG